MDQAQIIEMCSAFDGVLVMEADGDSYFIVDPQRDLPDNRKIPFATVITGDRHDTASDLDRDEATFRLNLGLTKATYGELFGDQGVVDDHTQVDRLLPHPIYGGQHWVCVVNPGPRTGARIRPLLEEAYAFALRKHTRYVERATA